MNAKAMFQQFAEPAVFDARENTSGVVFYIVGNKFVGFADGNVILTYAQALQHLAVIAPIAKCVVIGQGLSSQEVAQLQQNLAALTVLKPVPLLHRLEQKISPQWVDKTADKNVYITRPKQHAPLNFSSHLMLDEDCAAMADCNGGEHIPGILLIEAAKQLFIASARLFDIAPDFAGRDEAIQFTLRSLDVRFSQFVFPLAAQLHLTLSDVNISKTNASGVASVKVLQLNRICSEITFHANAHTKKSFSSLEKRCVIKTLKRMDYDQPYF